LTAATTANLEVACPEGLILRWRIDTLDALLERLEQ
jgi:hypothetical protein